MTRTTPVHAMKLIVLLSWLIACVQRSLTLEHPSVAARL